MKKKRLLKTVFATVLTWMVCSTGAWADTSVIQNGVGGWTKVSSMPSNLTDYFFVFVDKDNDLMMSYGEGINQTSSDSYLTMVYRTSEDPARNPLMLWTLENNDGGYSIKSAVEPTYYIQTENNAAWNCRAHDNGNGNASWYKWNITLSDGAYRIENGKYTGNYIGPWNGGAFSNGQEVAGNKTASGQVGYFYIYSILRSAVDLTGVTTATTSTPFNYTYKIKNPNAVKNTNGWNMGANTGRNNGTGTFDGVEGFFEPSQWGWNDFDIEMSQSVSGLPAGKYRLRAAIQSSSDCTVTLKANNNSSEAFQGSGTSNGTILQTGKEATEGNGVEGWKWRSLDFTDVTGTINIVFNSKTSATHNWANVDNVELYLLTPCLSALATSLPSGTVSADKWYVATIPSDGDYDICTTNAATVNYTQDGAQLADNISSSSVTLAANGKKNVSLSAGKLYVKSSAASTISIETTVYNFADGQDITSMITNPGFESNGSVVNLSSENLTGVTGWTLVTAENTNDVGTRAYSNSTFAALNGVGDYCFNCYWEGKPLTQNIGTLPAGTYELSALVTTGNASSIGTVFLNANNNKSTGYARKSANANYYVRERLVFTLTESGEVTIGIRGGSDPATGANKGTWVENGYWWYKCDDFKLTYLCKPTQANLASKLATLIANCEPWTTSGEYYTNYQTYRNYTSSNTVAELTTAINYLTNEYEKYALENATVDNPYDVEKIVNPSYNNDMTSWSETHNNTGNYTHGITTDGGNKFYQVSTNTYLRHATIYQEGIILDEGIYKLSAKMKGTPKDDVSTFIYATTGAVAHWEDPVFKGTTYYGYLTQTAGSSWSTVDAYITLDAPTKVRIGVLSWGNNWNGGNGGAFSVDDWKLEKIDYAVTTKSGVTTAIGPAPIATINSALTSEVAALDLQKATGLTSATISTTNNPNLLIFANSGQVSNSNNVVVDGTCSNLVLVDGHPFVNPTSFTATNASYTLSALADNKFATLIVPFNATKPGGTAYKLDQGVNLIDGNVRGTSASVEANSPVIVTAAGDYTGSGVTVPAVASGATFTNGELIGTYTAMAAPANSYVLQNHSNRVAFYLVGETKPTVNPFRAYIKPQSSNVKAISVMFDEDGIEGLTPNPSPVGEGSIYNVAGQRLSKPQRGVNIINGKKVIIK